MLWGGVSPIEEYYYLREYLKYNEKPEYIIYTQGVSHFLVMETLWTRSVYFHRMDYDDLNELLDGISQYEDMVSEAANRKREIFLYQIYSPTKYSAAFMKRLLRLNHYQENIDKYNETVRARGQTQFGTAESFEGMNQYAEYDSFKVNQAIDFYFCRIIELCLENQIQFVFQNPPINENTYANLQEPFVADFYSYLYALQKKYPSVRIDVQQPHYENEYFGDATHLNKRGSIRFSQEMRRKYKYIFEP